MEALNQASRYSVEKQTGLTVEQIVEMDIEDIDSAIEKKIGKKLGYTGQIDPRLRGRGSVYMALNRFFRFDHKKMNRKIDGLIVK